MMAKNPMPQKMMAIPMVCSFRLCRLQLWFECVANGSAKLIVLEKLGELPLHLHIAVQSVGH